MIGASAKTFFTAEAVAFLRACIKKGISVIFCRRLPFYTAVYFEETDGLRSIFMKKPIISTLACLLVAGVLFAQEDAEAAESKVAYTTHINLAIAWPMEGKLNVSESFKVPALNFNNALMRGNNVTFKLGADITPITLEGKFDITWTPIAFLELYGGASIGSGWTLKQWHGLSFNTEENGKTAIVPINFKKAFYTANLGGALQFDLGAVIPSDWTHIVFRIDEYFMYKGVSATGPYDSWIFQNDAGENRNGWTYYGTYVLGYQMPLPVNLIAFRVETEKTFFKLPSGIDKAAWGENRYTVTFTPIVSFKAAEALTIMLLAQWKTVHNYSASDLELFYQNRKIDKNKADKIIFKRVGIIFDIKIPNN